MELLLNRPLPLAFSSVSFSTPKRSITIPPKSQKKISLSSYFTFRITRNVQVSAHFGGTTSRRNSLRKKLLDDQQVSQKNPTSLTPGSNFGNQNLEFDRVNDSSGSVGFIDVVGADSNGLGELESLEEGLYPKSRKLGDSVLLTRLENWIDQYKEEGAYWGIGSSPIFTVFHDADGNVNKVVVDEDEILRRSQIWKKEEADSMIERARGLAREMERGGDVIPRSSSVAKFVFSDDESGFVNTIRAVVLQPEFVPVVSKMGGMVFFGFVAVWALIKLLGSKGKEETYTELEKEMMRRKIKSRKEKEMLEKGRVEVVQGRPEPAMMSIEMPKLDRKELMKNISEAKFSKDKVLLVDSSSSEIVDSMVLDGELQTIRATARQAREIESGVPSTDIMDKEVKVPVTEDSSCEMQEVEEHKEEFINSRSDVQATDSGKIRHVKETATEKTLNEFPSDNTKLKASSEDIEVINSSNSTKREVSKDVQTMVSGEVSDIPDNELSVSANKSIRTKSRLIRSVKEAREFLARKGDKLVQEPQLEGQRSVTILSPHSDEVTSGIGCQRGDRNEEVHEPIPSASISGSLSSANACEDTIPDVKESVPVNSDDFEDSKEGHEVNGLRYPQALYRDTDASNAEVGQTVKMENWLENNFHEVEPILEKIGDGFRNNYKIAREKKELATNISPDIAELNYKDKESELEWMKDDHLREIVFQVRENELTGKEPFHMMDAEDKLKFFKGLEKKVEQENNRLLQVHEYLHSNIENLDYGADGISIHDRPEKIIPRWKGPPIEKNPEFLNNFLEQKNAFFASSAGTSHPVKKDEQILPHNSIESPVSENIATTSVEYTLRKNSHVKDPKDSKIVIEGSDGSVRAGKKIGKEYWQHTKKWSRGFLESYNAETDPEVKSIMKDMGKDLDRWITEEEIQEAADLMTKLPERNKKFMEKKINKLKREMELFGPQAVVSKYSEYADDKEEDYLWWLDLQHILCIELYTIEDEKQTVGFYSLEMAADLELEPKPCHVIAFEDAGDCKNLCYIIQAHLEMLGKGHAFVVPMPPKDAFREARANGFGVTVIRKGEVQLNVDQTLEEVEEQITEIGSKMYHDKLMQERSVDMSSLMKGVFGANGETSSNKKRRKRSKRVLKKPNKE